MKARTPTGDRSKLPTPANDGRRDKSSTGLRCCDPRSDEYPAVISPIFDANRAGTVAHGWRRVDPGEFADGHARVLRPSDAATSLRRSPPSRRSIVAGRDVGDTPGRRPAASGAFAPRTSAAASAPDPRVLLACESWRTGPQGAPSLFRARRTRWLAAGRWASEVGEAPETSIRPAACARISARYQHDWKLESARPGCPCSKGAPYAMMKRPCGGCTRK